MTGVAVQRALTDNLSGGVDAPCECQHPPGVGWDEIVQINGVTWPIEVIDECASTARAEGNADDEPPVNAQRATSSRFAQTAEVRDPVRRPDDSMGGQLAVA